MPSMQVKVKHVCLLITWLAMADILIASVLLAFGAIHGTIPSNQTSQDTLPVTMMTSLEPRHGTHG